MTISTVPIKKIKKEIRKAMELLSNRENVELEEGDYPEVEVKQGEGSYYSLRDRTIYISPRDIGNGITYFEETSHALRDLILRRKGIEFTGQDVQVHEFLGRAGETLGREISKGTDLEHLFEGYEARDTNSPGFKKRWINRLGLIRDLKGYLRERKRKIAKGREHVSQLISESYHQIQDLFQDYGAGEISEENLKEETENVKQKYLRGMREYSENPNESLGLLDLKQVKSFEDMFDYLGEVFDISKDMPDKEKRDALSRSNEFLSEMYHPEKIRFDVSDIEEIEAENRAEEVRHSFRSHKNPYSYAQQYSSNELPVGLYSMGDEEIRRRFFHKKKSLEEVLEALFIVMGFLSLIYTLNNLRLTGFVVGGLRESGYLIIVFAFSLIALIYLNLKIRK